MSGEPPVPVLPPALLLQCYAEAARAYPEEACGLLLGPAGSAGCDEVRPCENQQNRLHALDPETFPRDARTAYHLSARDLLYLDRSLGGPRPVKVVYHSHVDVGAYFSEEDRRAATYEGELLYPVDYLVIACGAAGARAARLFRFRAGVFVEVARYDSAGGVS